MRRRVGIPGLSRPTRKPIPGCGERAKSRPPIPRPLDDGAFQREPSRGSEKRAGHAGGSDKSREVPEWFVGGPSFVEILLAAMAKRNGRSSGGGS
jgi:hypothetical protein